MLLLGLYHGLKTYHLHTVTMVFDGETIQLDDGRIIRLIGVDAPEVRSSFCKDEPFGEESKRYLASLILHKRVSIALGDPASDKYNRVLAYVYLGDILVNGRMIRDGWACSYRQFDYSWHDLFLSYENEARSRGLGIWKNGRQDGE